MILCEIRAAFLLGGKWVWRTFRTADGNHHGAIITHGKSLGAQGWDFGNRDVREVS